jgi:hypothetical protein
VTDKARQLYAAICRAELKKLERAMELSVCFVTNLAAL